MTILHSVKDIEQTHEKLHLKLRMRTCSKENTNLSGGYSVYLHMLCKFYLVNGLHV